MKMAFGNMDDPSSVVFCNKLGLDYVSCSPFRVPIARLAAAQAALRRRSRKTIFFGGGVGAGKPVNKGKSGFLQMNLVNFCGLCQNIVLFL